jgi:hypothetical protein
MDMPQGLPQATCLSIDDVLNIPPGDAVGTVEWGTYRPVTNVRTSCAQCQLNTIPESNCTESTIDPTVLTTFTQNDGELKGEGTDGSSFTGSINADSTFVIGRIVTPMTTDGTPTGQGLGLIGGRFVGNRVIATTTLRLTINEADGRTTDLQFISDVTLERVE